MHLVERRASQRYELCLPLAAKLPGGKEIFAHTRDVSCCGICFYSSNAVAVGSALKFTLTLPPEVTLSAPVKVRCIGRVVRVTKRENPGQSIIAAVIDDYDFSAA